MPDEERAICRRLRQFRLFTGLDQAEFAAVAGLDPSAYAGYEYARSQLNYPAAWRILNAFRRLNPIWLAEGGPDAAMLDLFYITSPAPEDLPDYGPRTPFSIVFHALLHHMLISSRSAWVSSDQPFPLFRMSPDIPGRLAGKDIFADLIALWLAGRLDSKVNEFLDALGRAAQPVLDAFPWDSPKNIEQRLAAMLRLEAKRRASAYALADLDLRIRSQGLPKISQRKLLTDVAASGKLAPVKSQLKNLLAELSRLTQRPGQKTKLAKFLGAPLTSVSRWLSGEREPGGEIALKMRYWADHPELHTK
jgi:transcriptional regulator with XRE-family HTH domain